MGVTLREHIELLLRKRKREGKWYTFVCVCVCVCVKERERKSERAFVEQTNSKPSHLNKLTSSL